MKTSSFLRKALITLLSLIYSEYLTSQTCIFADSMYTNRSTYSCSDLDDLYNDEVLAMPIMYIPVVFHFIRYDNDSYLNFTCDDQSAILNTNWLLYAPTFAYYVIGEMNDKMSNQLNPDHSGALNQTGLYSDSRVRYYFLNGTDNCSSLYFHDNYSSSILISGALNIVFRDNGGATVSGSTNYGSNTIFINNVFRSFYYNLDNNTWGVGRLINHENGHRFRLNHTFNCLNPCRGISITGSEHCCGSCWNNDSQNTNCGSGTCSTVFMMGYAQFLMLTPCEHREMWSYQLKTPFSYVDYCNEESEVEALTYDTGTKLYWTGQRLINADVIIKNGTEIEISCDVYMGKDKKIIVERGARLTLNGGRIKGLCDYVWSGIKVEGVSNGLQLQNYDDPLDENKAGTVVLINNSTISEAKTAISMANSQYTWPDFADYYGGLVYCEDSKIFDCDRAVEFMKYGKDNSKFLDSEFENLKYGVTIWSSNGIIFNSCDFTNIEKSGILIYDSWANIYNGCKFENIPTGVELLNTHSSLHGSLIGSSNDAINLFINTDYGIHGTNLECGSPVRIIRNSFTDDDDTEYSDIGTHLNGLSYYFISSNVYDDVFSSQELMATGPCENYVYKNYMIDNTLSTHFMYDNLGSIFLNNCYTGTSSADVELNHSKIFPIQGSASTSASNCFTKNTIPSIHCNSNINSVKYYKYGTSCYDPATHSGCNNITESAAFSINSIFCPTSITPEYPDYAGGCSVPSSIEGILDSFNSLDDSISSTQSNTQLNTQSKLDLITGFRRCQSTLMAKYILLNLEDAEDFETNLEDVVDLLDSRAEFIYKIWASGLLLSSGNYQRSRQYINGVTTNNQDEEDYVIVENINLNFLEDLLEYAASQNTLDTLIEIGSKPHPYSGFARSVYHRLTSTRLDLEKPEISGVIIPRSPDEGSKFSIRSFPNPAKDGSFTFQVRNNKTYSDLSVNVYTSTGAIQYVKEVKLSSDLDVTINTNEWPSNLYHLVIRSADGTLIHSDKFTVINKY